MSQALTNETERRFHILVELLAENGHCSKYLSAYHSRRREKLRKCSNIKKCHLLTCATWKTAAEIERSNLIRQKYRMWRFLALCAHTFMHNWCSILPNICRLIARIRVRAPLSKASHQLHDEMLMRLDVYSYVVFVILHVHFWSLDDFRMRETKARRIASTHTIVY